MNRYNFSEEEINRILLSSPMVLPNNPSECGLRGDNIKAYFYSFIRKLMLLINEHFILIKNDKDASISSHNDSSLSHGDIRQILSNLEEKDVELGNAISNHYNQAESKYSEIGQKISNDIGSHNLDEYAHTSLRAEVLNAKQIAENALNSAQGKTRVYPVKDAKAMVEALSDSINIGDRFVLSDKNIPDFTLFDKNSTEEDAIHITNEEILSNSVEFLPGESYLYNGYLLVATESGIDTSLLVKVQDFELLELIVSELDREIEDYALNYERKLAEKEDKYRVISESGENITLQSSVEYRLGLRTSLNLILPTVIPDEFECIVSFRTGENGIEFTCDGVIMTQDDCYQGVFTPCKNRIYEINIKNVEGTLIGKIGTCDYTAN